MSLILQSSGGGQITIQEPATASNFTQTLPAADGVTMVSGNMPAFNAYQSSAQSLSNATLTKLQFQTEEYDTSNAFDSTTNYRFQPQVAGYYQISGGFRMAAVNTNLILSLYKNGSEWSRINETGTATLPAIYNSVLMYLNGSTDYLELYAYQGAGSTQALSTGVSTRFQGVLVRAA